MAHPTKPTDRMNRTMDDDARVAKRQRTALGVTPTSAAAPAVAPVTIDLTASPSPPTSPTRHSGSSTNVAFRLTTLHSAPPTHNEFAVGLADLLAGDFTHVLLTNYMFDMPWLFGQCPRLHDVPVVLVHGERDRDAMARECSGYKNVVLVAPRLPIPYGTHHTKMMVVVYSSFVRVVICTANFIPIDWNNKTQGVWSQEFPLKSATSTSDPVNTVVDFERDLVDYLATLGKPVVDFCELMRRYEYSSADVALIPSVPGVHTGKDMDKYGHLRVRKLLQHFNAPRSDHPLVCQFSSLGSLDEKWLFGEFCASLMPGYTHLTPNGAAFPVRDFHILWPSVEDVRNSVEGWNAGRAVPCPLKNMKPFLHKYLRKWTPPTQLHRQNAMPHIKTYARFHPSQDGRLDWAILTSSNLSKAAWGAYQKNRSQFMIRSYELGVMFLPQHFTTRTHGTQVELVVVGSEASLSCRDQHRLVPLPYGFPIKTYDPKRDEPWVWDLVREDPDVFGNCYIPR